MAEFLYARCILIKKKRPDIILWAGSVIDPRTASLYVNSGANFIVEPVLNSEVAND